MAEAKQFRLKRAGDKRVITWPVDVNMPLDGGVTEKMQLQTKFLMLSRDEINKLLEEEGQELIGKSKNGLATPLLRTVVKGFPDFREDETGPVMEDEAAIPLLLGLPYVVTALTGAYLDMISGRPRKNS